MARGQVEFQTPRLELCQWRSGDWVEFRPIAADPRVMKFIGDGNPWPDEKIRKFVDRQVGHQRDLGYCLWQLRLRDDGTLIGFCGLQPVADSEEVEIGWWLRPDQWGQGLATEAATRVMQFAAESTDLQPPIAFVHPENRASANVARKLQMRTSGTRLIRGIRADVLGV